jgi:hypothetical protein
VLVSVTQQQDADSVTVAVASVMARVKPTGDGLEALVPWNVTRQDAVTLSIGSQRGNIGSQRGAESTVRVEDVLEPSDLGDPAESREPPELFEPAESRELPTVTIGADPSTGLGESPSGWRLRVAVVVFLVVALAVAVFVIWRLLS